MNDIKALYQYNKIEREDKIEIEFTFDVSNSNKNGFRICNKEDLDFALGAGGILDNDLNYYIVLQDGIYEYYEEYISDEILGENILVYAGYRKATNKISKEMFIDICNCFESSDNYSDNTIDELSKMDNIQRKIIFDFAELVTRNFLKDSNMFKFYFVVKLI